MMESRPINDKLWARALTLGAVKILDNWYTRRFMKYTGGVLFVSKFCIKTKSTTSLAEANTMQFIAQHTSIPVPKVFCAFTHKGRSYIVMEKIAGQTAGYGWYYRPEDSKQKILSQLKSLVQQLRSVPPPPGTGVANVVGGPIYDGRLPEKDLWGPYHTQEDFHKELRNGIGIDAIETIPGDVKELFVFHSQEFPPPVLTHGDLSSLNIIVKGNDIVGIIDWETAGWYPYYWEYARAWNANPQNQFWQDEVDKFMDPLSDALRADGIRRRYFGDF
ncbi:protein kinase-like domain-containing protein [Xylariomycetidae sp. FL2044]|nr:protein kinase-like domain-containing protein [Xylariomycetidae sp. FL2044]